jgi:hypothetical protein
MGLDLLHGTGDSGAVERQRAEGLWHQRHPEHSVAP